MPISKYTSVHIKTENPDLGIWQLRDFSHNNIKTFDYNTNLKGLWCLAFIYMWFANLFYFRFHVGNWVWRIDIDWHFNMGF